MSSLALDPEQALGLRHIQRAKNHRIQHAEYHGVGADRQSQRHDSDERKSRRLSQHAQAEAHILNQSLNEISAELFADFLFEALAAAELDTGAALRFSTIEARSFQIVGAVLKMRAQLFLDLSLDLRTAEKLSGQ